jgi:hypothetical protein
MARSKLLRNLKPGDRYTIQGTEPHQRLTLTVLRVEETSMGCFTGKRRWAVHSVERRPFWFQFPVIGYSDERIALA